MKRIKRFSFLMLLFVIAWEAKANPIDERTAREVAVKFMNANTETPLRGTDELQLVSTYTISRGDAAFYVFNTPNGFVIVSANDCATPVLGFSDEGRFDVENIPIQLQDYLQDFVEQIQYGIENHLEADEATARQWEMVLSVGRLTDQRATTAVGPLLTDIWSQGCYYNNKCPVDSNGPCGRVYTGCVATSFAQIMHYWGYPTTGVGSHTYTPSGYPEQTANFGATTYDWANMPNKLYSSSSSTQVDAVSTLMWHCGVAVDMMYGWNGSGAYSGDVATALVTYFGYSNELSKVYRNHYDNSEWMALIKNCLDLSCPIHYSGHDSNSGSGHAFVCDGYDSNDLLHFNWGWGGTGNGYFANGALNVQGHAYNESNMAIINIRPGCTSGTTYQITASTDPSNGGTVSGTGTYNCGDVCTLTATPTGDRTFMYWTEDGEEVSSEATYSFIAMKDRNLVAHFALPFSITTSVNPAEGGTVSGGGVCHYNQQITLTATPNEGYVFDKWTKDGEVFSYYSTLNLTVTEAAEYVAYFHQMAGILIGEATSTNSYLPTYYSYSLTEQIYTAEELNSGACEISSVSFFNTGSYYSNITRNMNIYMVNTDKTSFDSISDWIPVSEANLVFSGNVVFPAHDWVTVYFSTPFNYNGSSNVALIVDDNSNRYNSYTSCRTFTTEGNQAIRVFGSGTNYDPYNPSGYSGTPMSVKNQVVFGIPSYDYTITVSVTPTNGGTISGGGPCYLNQPVTLTATPNEGYVFNNWTKNGEVISYLSSYSLTVTESAEYVANFQQVDGIVIGDATYASAYLPTCSNYSLAEQIYTSDEIGSTPCQISSVSFFNTGSYYSNITRNMNIYMVNTDKTSFDSISDWIPVSEANLVYSGNVVIPAHDWATVYFSTPFNYNGSSNVALVVDDNTNNYSSNTTCRTFSSEGNQAIRVYGSGTNYDPYNPSGYTGTLMSVKNQVVFGIPSYDFTVTTTANPTNGGTISGGGLCYLNQPVTLTATPNVGYVFNNWTKNGEVISYFSSYSLTVTESAEYVANFQQVDGIVIGDAANTNSYLPTNSFYSLTEQIYTSEEMGGAATEISSVSFFNTGTSNRTRNMNIYMVNTNKTAFDSISDWIPVSEANLVFSGNVVFPAHDWATVYFSTPFNYNGSSNVALIVDDNSNTYNYGSIICRTFETNESQAIRINGSGTNYDPYNPSGYTGTPMTMKNQVVFGIPSYDYTITASVSPSNSGTTSGGGPHYLNQPITLIATPNEGYVFNNWTKDGEVISYLSNYTLTVTESAEFVANFQQVDGIVIGNATNTNAYLPIYHYYSLTEQIYTAEEMNSGACEISSVSFFNTGNYNYGITRNMNIYLVNTDKTSFDSISDWIPLSEAHLVFSGNVDFPAHNWVTIIFSTPFNYDGSSNVALIVDDNSNSSNSSTSCRTFSTEVSQAIRINGSGTNYDPYNPSGYTGTLMSMKNQVIFGFPSYDFTVTATANPTNGGTTSGGGPHYLNQPITLTATPNEGYVFNNWTKDGEVISYLSNYTLTVTESAEYVANFIQFDGIVIGDATHTNAYLPTYSYYPNSLTQQIYTAGEMGGDATEISSLSFFNTGNARTRNLSIYLVHTDKTAFNGTTDWIPVSESNQVFSGNVTLAANSWTTIYFTSPFYYNGSSNLALVVNDKTGSWNSGLSCRTFSTEGSQAIRIFGSGTNYDPYNPSGYTGTLMSMKNQVVFGIPSYDFTVTATANPTDGGTVSGSGLYYYNQSVTLSATPAEGYIFSNWTKDGEVISYVSKYSFSATESVEYVANFEVAPDGIVIGDATYTNAYLPTYYYYSLTEQIYTSDEMGDASCQISSVSFFNTGSSRTRNMNIYMVNTDKTAFDSISDWIPVSDDDLVFSGNVNFSTHNWSTVYFSTPFNYNGTSNVALVVDDNTNNYNSYTNCRTFNTDSIQAIYINGSGTNYDPYNPSGYTGTLMSMKNQVVFGIPSYDYTLTVTASPTEGGTISGGGDCYLNQPITLTATPNEGYVFRNWTKNGSVVSYVSKYNLTVTESAEYVANFEVAPDGIVIGDATYTNSYLPIYYYYSLSEQIYTADEMGGTATEISSVSFFNTGYNSVTRNLNIYMANTDKTSFEGSTDWIPVSENNLAFSGNVTFTAHDWVTIYFNTPFNYDGVFNVALIVDENSNSYNSYTNCRTFDTEVSQAIHISGSGTNYDPYNPTSYTGTLVSMKNQVVFGIPSYDYTVTASVNLEEGGSVSGVNGGPYFYGQPVTLTATPNEGYVFNYWTKNGEIVSCLSNYVLAVTESAEYVANFKQANGLVIGDATNSNAYLPTYTSYPYSLTQQIYTADEMGGEAAVFYSLSFFNTGTAKTRNLSIYMVNTSKAIFENTTDWITVTEADLVFSGSVVATATDWITVIFDTPFSYDGTSNVALIVDDNTNYWNSGLNCRTFSTEGNQAIRITNSGTNYDPYAPTGYIGTPMSMKNQVIFHLPQTVTATANPTGGGTISGTGNYALGATCTLTATPSTGYYFLNWTENGTAVSYNTTYSFTVDGDRNLVANFIEGESNCTISFDLYDSSNNGWSGNYLVVEYANDSTEQLTLPSGSFISYSREVATGSTIALSWIAGTNAYQCSFDVKFGNGVLIYHGASLNSNFQQELNINCAVATLPHTITAVANPEEGGTVEGAGTYEGGTAITLTATPNAGYSFVCWMENGTAVSTDANYSFIVDSDRDLVAFFSLPLTVSVTTNMAAGGSVTGGGTFDYGNTCTLRATPNEGYLFQNWSKNGEVVSCIATYSFTVTEDAEIEAVFMLLEGRLIGQGESTNEYLPSYTWYRYTLSQQIYTPGEIGEAGIITSISYYNGGPTQTRSYNIYMVHTDKTVFDSSTDWITVTEDDLVYSGSVDITKGYWTTIVLDTPFAYNGTSNLAIIVDDNTGTYLSSMACRVFNANGYQAIRVYSDNTNYDPYNPSEFSGARHSVKNQMILGVMSAYHFATAGTWSNATNWSGGTLPGTNDAVFIDANCTFDNDDEVALLSITPGNTLTLQPNKTLTVTGQLFNTDTTALVIKDGAQLVNASANVAATMEKDVTAFGNGNPDGWYTISSPMNGMAIAGSDFLTPSYDLYRFNETSLNHKEWENYKANLSDFTTFENGRGYLYANSSTFSPAFTGILNASDVTYSLTCTNRPNDSFSGFNLIGNPFPHEIYKGAGGAIDNANLASGYYTLTNEGTWEPHTYDEAIQPGQGILVKATAPTVLTIAKTIEMASSESGEAKGKTNQLRISVKGDSGQDQTYVYFGQGVGLDKKNDLNGQAPSLWVRANGNDYAIAHVDSQDESLELCFSGKQDGDFTLSVVAGNTKFKSLQLTDRVTGTTVDLLKQPNYSFHATGQEPRARFSIEFRMME